MDQRQVRPDRDLPAERLVDQGLAGGVVEMIVAANHVGHAHVVVIDHHGQVIGRRTVGAQQDQVVQILVLEPDVPLHLVGHHRVAGLRTLQAHDKGAVRGVVGGDVAPGRTDHPALGPRRLALGVQLLRRHVVAIGFAAGQELVHGGAMQVGPGGLEHRRLVGLKAQPLQALEDDAHGGLGGALAIGVLDAQKELSAGASGVKPVEKRRAGRANMHRASGRGGDPGDDGTVGHRGRGS